MAAISSSQTESDRTDNVSGAVAEVRTKSQVTVPKAMVEALGLEIGDRLLFLVDDPRAGTMRVIRLPQSFAGLAPDAYGTENSTEYVRSERASWSE